MPLAHGDGGTPATAPPGAAEPRPLVPEVCPPEAGTLSSEACDDKSATLFGTLSRWLGDGRKSYWGAFVKGMHKRLNPVKKRSTKTAAPYRLL